MATVSVPDNKSLPNYSLIGGEPELKDAKFPLKVFFKEGYARVPVATGTTSYDLIFTPPVDWKYFSSDFPQVILARIGNCLITPFSILAYSSMWDTQSVGDGLTDAGSLVYRQGVTYKFVIRVYSANRLRVLVYSMDGTDYLASMELNDVGVSLDPVVTNMEIGYLPSSIRGAVSDEITRPFSMRDAEGLVYNNFRVTSAATALELSPKFIATEWAKANRRIVKLNATHPYEKDGFKFDLMTGAGDTDNSSFVIDGKMLKTVEQLTEGYKYIRVRTRDRFGWDLTSQLILGVGVSTPTDIDLSGDTVEAGAGSTGVGSFTTTDADTGETHTYTLVAGTGDTDNALFEIRNSDELHFKVAPTEVGGPYSIRVRSTDIQGLYYDEVFNTIRSVDTTAPAVLGIAGPPEVEDTYDIPISSITTEHTPDVGALQCLILDTVFGAEEPVVTNDTPGWAAMPESFPFNYTLTNQGGEGDYVVYVWVKDASGNISPSDNIQVSVIDTLAPVVSAFDLAASLLEESYTVTVTNLAATDEVTPAADIQFCYTETNVAPLVNDPGWHLVQDPEEYTIQDTSGPGEYTIYVWAKDSGDNISAVAGNIVIIVDDTTAPVMDAFNIAHTGNSYNVTVGGGHATDFFGVTGYIITETDTPPASNDPNWVTPVDGYLSAGSYIIQDQHGSGTYTLYCWAKDPGEHVSAYMSHDTDLTIS